MDGWIVGDVSTYDVAPQPIEDMWTPEADLGPPRDAAVAPNPVVRGNDLVYSRKPCRGTGHHRLCGPRWSGPIDSGRSNPGSNPTFEGWAEADVVDGAYVGQVMGEYTVTCRELRSRISMRVPNFGQSPLDGLRALGRILGRQYLRRARPLRSGARPKMPTGIQ